MGGRIVLELVAGFFRNAHGANDHGKSNVLRCFPYLNDGPGPQKQLAYSGKEPEKRDADYFPDISFTFEWSEYERARLEKLLLDAGPVTLTNLSESEVLTARKAIRSDPRITEFYRNSTLRVFKNPNVSGSPLLHLPAPEFVQDAERYIESVITERILNARPRVVFFMEAPFLPDTISLKEVETPTNPVIRGLLRLGGYFNKRKVLGRDDNAGRRARLEFNRSFNREFARRYSQYRKVEWSLDLANSGAELVLELSDHGYDLGSPGDRSVGFRSWLAFLLALFGETGESSPSGCLIVIDEPDIHLHLKGQKDMLAYLEELSATNMVVFATHSPFMIPRKFPQRVKQIVRETSGSQVNENPYRDNWTSVVADLGFAGADIFRFADKFLVVEGVADHLLITALICLSAGLGNPVPDLDDIAVRWHDGATWVPHVVRAIDDSKAKVLAIVDDDREGLRASQAVANLKRRNVKALTLAQLVYWPGSTIEDVIPSSAVADSVRLLLERLAQTRNFTIEQIDEAVGLVGEAAVIHPRRTALAELLVTTGWLQDARDFPSRQFANCAATCLSNSSYPLTADC